MEIVPDSSKDFIMEERIMKKVLALVLAVAMMSTVAFAASNTVFGSGYDKEPNNIPSGTSDIKGSYGPGEDFSIASGDLNTDGDKKVSDLNTDNYSIKKVTYKAGKSYIDSIELDNDEGDELTVTFKKDYSVEKAKDVEVFVELRGKGNNVDAKTVNVKFGTQYVVGTNPVAIDKDGDIDEKTLNLDMINKFDSGKDGSPYGTLSFDTDDGDTTVEARVYDGDKLFLGHDFDADKKVLVANADADAEISFLNFPAKPSFNSTATVYFYQVDKDGFVYELTGEGKIKKSAAKWSEDDGCWVLKTRTLGSYVFSDKALTSAADSGSSSTDGEGTNNPDTGANDVVGIAAALAVVSVIAAGAVSLKK